MLFVSEREASSIGAAKALVLRRVRRKAVDEICIIVSVTDRQCEFFGWVSRYRICREKRMSIRLANSGRWKLRCWDILI